MSINISSSNSTVRRITPEDDDFCIISGYAYYPRAGVEITSKCPADYRATIKLAITKGWVEPVAHVKESEYMWEKLNDNAS
ncbi:hypothetical protein UFOVP328_39 [uncultured Caudovirales phage]|uniref:Uncharacterized protein n=1 Tax=uncultured Caudovirales phage TaxID=2100421 RepID=A0A6J5LSY7_9CAUD|nr:hypothetical protein UFOVP328_39 [uncultured Caudovirales phage]